MRKTFPTLVGLLLLSSPLLGGDEWNPSTAKTLEDGTLWFTKIDVHDQRKEYLQLNTDSKPFLFYEHERIIEPILGHLKKLVLVNDYFASKANQIFIVELSTMKKRRIDLRVIARYDSLYPKSKIKTTFPCGNAWAAGLLILPEAIDLSPDDTEVLIEMTYGGFVYPTSKNPHPEKNFKALSYVVDSRLGKILKTYSTDKVPQKWWISSEKK